MFSTQCSAEHYAQRGDAKLGNGALSKNQEMLIEMIKTGNFEVDVVRSGKILIDGINLTKITFDQINIVTSISKDIAGTITKVWP